MLLLFSLSVLSAAGLLFLVEPMVGKMLLPRLGGAPSVWNTCMLFFQAALLSGYALAHLVARRLSLPLQVAVQAALFSLAGFFLPIEAGRTAPPPEGGSPLAWQLGALARGVGIPFLALAAAGPLLQSWFARSEHPRARDPYLLYAASNLGSLGGLLLYPFLVEPMLPIGAGEGGPRGPTQSGLWSAGFLLCAAGVVLCGIVVAVRPRTDPPKASVARPPGSPRSSLRQKARWVGFAFVPSSLLLGATSYMTTDLASIPLLWVVPLCLYLASFIVTFAQRRREPSRMVSDLFAVVALVAAASFWAYERPAGWLLLGVHSLLVLLAGLVCHGRLAAERPAPELLTGYYLAIGVGGALGGVFNAVLAPVVFSKVGIVEYPLAVWLASLARPGRAGERRAPRISRALADLGLAGAVVLAVLLAGAGLSTIGPLDPAASVALRVGIPSLLVLCSIRRRIGFALGLAVLLAAGWIEGSRPADTLERTRTYFGSYRIVRRLSGPFRQTTPEAGTRTFVVPYNILYHGNTRHGLQALDPVLGPLPTSYYHRTSPIGEVLEAFGPTARLDRIALVGLGIGTLAAYGRPGQRFTCYELDPEVVRIARDSGYFSYLRDTKAEVEFVFGDGRLGLARAPDAAFGLIVLDAFNSDAIPVHLLTREAIALCMRKLRPDGLLAVHLTNQYLDLEPVVDAAAADLGLAGLSKSVTVETAEELLQAKDRSTWAVLAKEKRWLWPLGQDGSWIVLPLNDERPGRRRYLWTDDRVSILPLLKW